MNKIQHLKMTKQFLRKVVGYRRNLLRMNAGKPASESMVASMSTIPYNISCIDNFDRMHNYISRKKVQNDIQELIPSNKRAVWATELQHLVIEGNKLAGKLPVHCEIEF